MQTMPSLSRPMTCGHDSQRMLSYHKHLIPQRELLIAIAVSRAANKKPRPGRPGL